MPGFHSRFGAASKTCARAVEMTPRHGLFSRRRSRRRTTISFEPRAGRHAHTRRAFSPHMIPARCHAVEALARRSSIILFHGSYAAPFQRLDASNSPLHGHFAIPARRQYIIDNARLKAAAFRPHASASARRPRPHDGQPDAIPSAARSRRPQLRRPSSYRGARRHFAR